MIQLIDLLDEKKINDNYLKKIYYFCCIIGGYESIDYMMHLLVYNISKSIMIDLSFYYFKEFDFNLLLENTKKNKHLYSLKEIDIFNKFIDKIKNNKIINKFNRYDLNLSKNKIDEIEFLFENSVTFRGYNQHINHHKVFIGNFRDYGRTTDFIINNQDILFLKKLKQKFSKDFIKAFTIYFQSYQMFHFNKFFYMNHQSLVGEKNICVKGIYNKDCKPRENEYFTNISTSVQNYGDCREINIIYNLYHLFDEMKEFIKAFEKNDFNKMENLIMNQIRLFSLGTMFDGRLTQPFNNIKYYYEYDYNKLKKNDILTKKEKMSLNIIDGKRFFRLENHNVNISFNFNNNNYTMKMKDLLYNKYNVNFNMNNKFDALYLSDYILDGINVFLKKEKTKSGRYYLDLGSNYFNNMVDQVALFEYNLFKNTRIEENINSDMLYYLSEPFYFSNNIFNINKFIIEREGNMFNLRKKYFNKNNKIYRYKKEANDLLVKYFLMEDINIK